MVDTLNMKCHLLQSCAVVPLILGLAFESVAGGTGTKNAPVLLEQTEVGRIVGLSVAIGVVGGVHGFAMWHYENQKQRSIKFQPYISSMAMARSRVLPPAFKMACLCAPIPLTVSEPRSSLLLRSRSSAMGEASAAMKIAGRRARKDLIMNRERGNETRLSRT